MSPKLLIIGGILIVGIIILLLFVVLQEAGVKTPERVTLEFWGVFDDASFFDDAIRGYRAINPRVNISYRKFTFEDYERQLLDSFAAGRGPDIWMMHNTWLPKHKDKIQPLPQFIQGQKEPLFTFKDFKEQFVDVAVTDLTDNNQIFALPIYVDTLTLLYNKDIFNNEGIARPPATWDEFNNVVEELTQFDQRGNIVRSAAAIGTSKNINRSTDILMLLMLQSGVKMVDDSRVGATFSKPVQNENIGEVSLEYYTDFANPAKRIYTFNNALHYSIDAFQEGSAAMMFNYSHQIGVIRSKAPRFNLGIASMPQISLDNIVNYANYWAPTVSKASKNQIEAWKFLAYLSSQNGSIFYLNATSRPAARRDLIELQKTDPDLGVFATQALSAHSWYQIDNAAIENIFAEMIDNVNFGRLSIRNALKEAENKVSVLMQRARARELEQQF